MTKPLPFESRKNGYWLNVIKLPDEGVSTIGGCWLWQGQLGSSGYGQCSYKGRAMMAHRASWVMEYGPIPVGLLILHKCDVHNCVRPDHLFLGTYKDNMDDMYAKGRGPTGDKNGSRTRPSRRAFGDRNGSRTCPESRQRGTNHYLHKNPSLVLGVKNPNSRLSDDEVALIIKLYANGKGEKQVDLAERFGVSQTHISRLVRGLMRSWIQLTLIG